MNIATHRFTISTMVVAVCAMVALVAAEPAQAQAQASPPVQRIEVVGQRVATLHRFVVVGQRKGVPTVQRIEIVGRRQPTERVAAAPAGAPAL
jgi:hypothetical protein